MRKHLLVLCVLASACSMKKLAVGQTADILLDAGRAFETENDLELAAAAIPGSLKTMEGFLEADPEQRVLLRLLADGYMSYAFGFLEDEAERVQESEPRRAAELGQRALNLYLRSRSFGLRLLALDQPQLAGKLTVGGMPTAAELAALDADDLPGLFWTANPWGAAINAGKSDPALVSQLTLVRTLMERCAAIDENFYWAGPQLALGAMDAGLPKALGGKPENAKQHFERAIQLTGGKHLMTKVLYGRTVGVQASDRKLFERIMTEVVNANPDSEPRLTLANRLAQRRAKRYLQQLDDFFVQ